MVCCCYPDIKCFFSSSLEIKVFSDRITEHSFNQLYDYTNNVYLAPIVDGDISSYYDRFSKISAPRISPSGDFVFHQRVYNPTLETYWFDIRGYLHFSYANGSYFFSKSDRFDIRTSEYYSELEDPISGLYINYSRSQDISLDPNFLDFDLIISILNENKNN